jgi:hypothetical protein
VKRQELGGSVILDKIATTPGVATAIITSAVAFVVGFGSLSVSFWTLRKTGARAVANFRQEWINTLRQALAQYHSIMMTTQPPLSCDDDRKASDLGTRIELMLNPTEDASQELEAAIDKIDVCQTLDGRLTMDKEFAAAARRVLKQEWDRVRAETQMAKLNWRRGFFRLWLLFSAFWIIIIGFSLRDGLGWLTSDTVWEALAEAIAPPGLMFFAGLLTAWIGRGFLDQPDPRSAKKVTLGQGQRFFPSDSSTRRRT